MTSSAHPPGCTLADSWSLNLAFDDLYIKQAKLRAGSYGVVWTCQHKLAPSSDEADEGVEPTTYAVKIMDRSKLKEKDDKAVFREVAIMKELVEVPTVVRLIDFFESPAELFIVQVFAAGGDVFDRLSKRTHYTEKDARDLAETLVETLQAIHKRGICHRDLKPENLLLLNKRDDASILLADFGFARHVTPENKCTTRCGTPAYVAPEVVIGTPYGTQCDMWSIGCLLYMLIGGYPPFQGKNHREIFRKIRAADYIFHETYWKSVSIPAKRMISSFLTPNPDLRWDADTALEGEWFNLSDVDSLRSTDLSGSLVEMRKFRPKRTWKSAAHAVRFATTASFWNTEAVSFASSLSETTKSGELKGPSFHDTFALKKKLRKGSYATVWKGVHKETEEVVAVKIIMRKGLSPSDDEAILNEVSVMLSLKNQPHVVQLKQFYEEPDYFYLVMEHMAGGDVFDRIVKMKRYTEGDARDLVMILLKAMKGIHDMGIAHRDVKPQNLLLVDKEDNATIKVADFGFARRVHMPQSLNSRCGTPSYVAPEILKNVPHDQRTDMWSIGVVTFVLLVGYPPFMEDDQPKLFSKIRNCEYQFVEADWVHISEEAKVMIRGLLTTNQKERWTIQQCLECDWIGQSRDDLSDVSLDKSVVLMKKEKKQRFNAFARAIMWFGNNTSENVNFQAQIEVPDDAPDEEHVLV